MSATGVYMKYRNFSFVGSNGYPIPQVSISKEFDRDGAGRIIGSSSTVSLEGVIINTSSDLEFSTFITKVKEFRDVFSKDGSFMFGCGTNFSTPSYSGNAKVSRVSLDKTENQWVQTIAYSIDLIVEDPPTANCSSTGIYNVSSCQDEWNFETLEEYNYVNNPVGGTIFRNALNFPLGTSYPIYRISRTIGAVGKFVPDASGTGVSAVSNAKLWVGCRLNTAPESSITGIVSGLQLFNFVRSIAVDDPGGSYRITDNWLATSTTATGLYLESFNVDSSLDNSFLRTITVNGTIKGLEKFNSGIIYNQSTIGTGLTNSFNNIAATVRTDIGTSKFDAAINGYNMAKSGMFARAQGFLDKQNDPNSTSKKYLGRDESPLNPIPLSVTEGFNPADGSVTYSWSYNNRPLNLINGSISETLTINDTFAVPVVAELFVLGRRLGPVLQSLGTYTTPIRDVTFDVIMPRPTGLQGLRFPRTAYVQITGLVETLNPIHLMGPGSSASYVKSDTEDWSVTEGRFTKRKTWAWQTCVIPLFN